MINDRYYVKIVPEKGETVHRFHLRRRHIVVALIAFAAIVLGSFGFAALTVARAHAQVSTLKAQAAEQQATLTSIDRETNTLRQELQHVQKQNQEIRQLIGAPAPKPTPRMRIERTSAIRNPLASAALRIDALSAQGAQMRDESDAIRRIAMHVLNLRHLRDLARAELIASIPSIDPVDGAPVISCFCYRTAPDREFHEGVDLEADYGVAVRASAAGTVVANGYDGGYGIKIDIDHGNGYHTWYAHLSRVDVQVGSHVYKGQAIGAVGTTGFATGPHLHYQVMRNGVAIDPAPFLTGVPSNVLAALP